MDKTGADRQRRYMARLKARTVTDGAASAEIAELTADLAKAKAKITELHVEARELRAATHPQSGRAKRAGNPPLPPNEARDRQIKSLKSRVQNLSVELRAMRDWRGGEGRKGMSFRTMSVLAKCLHPDTRQHATATDLDEACRLFLAWKRDGRGTT
jgi:predicted RNase H-like nuclease (RuvC/YqgF family)